MFLTMETMVKTPWLSPFPKAGERALRADPGGAHAGRRVHVGGGFPQSHLGALVERPCWKPTLESDINWLVNGCHDFGIFPEILGIIHHPN